ncbi:SDR family oxidoreductase [Aquabacter sp. CN5-332]|uniref:SDR family NAD(P)-dependent oxidoreductase n=1 Tax=Aquabacter sp. CN5-332 TaxID=3156608 RepID=UPI0032B591B8
MRHEGKVALVTGGSQGIGEAICRRLAAEGATVYVIASSDIAKAQAVCDSIRSSGAKAQAATADVSKAEELAALAQRVAHKFGTLDILVNSAGVFYPTPVGTPASEVDRMIDINLKGTIFAITAFSPLLSQGGGKIVNLSSCAGMMGLRTYSVYCATKAAIAMLTRSLALELAPLGINVNAIAPGNTATPINEDIRTRPDLAPFLNAMAEKTPSGRTYSDPQDIAALASFLSSDEAKAMHGSTILIDEGFTAGM